MLPMFFVHHRVKLISIFVDGKLHIITQQRHNAGAPLRFVPPSMKTIEEVLQLNLHLRAIYSCYSISISKDMLSHIILSFFFSAQIKIRTTRRYRKTY